jgi:hypothetical protein
MRFFEATQLDAGEVAAVQETVRGRVLDLFARDGLLDGKATANMHTWSHGSRSTQPHTAAVIEAVFSPSTAVQRQLPSLSVQLPASDASAGITAHSVAPEAIRMEAWDRTGLERLLRYCARPPFASERLSWEKRSERVVYEPAKPRPNAPSAISFDPLELIDHLVLLIAPPGAAFVRDLAATGAVPVILDLRPDRVDQVVRETERAGVKTAGWVCDVAERAQVEATFAEMEASSGASTLSPTAPTAACLGLAHGGDDAAVGPEHSTVTGRRTMYSGA